MSERLDTLIETIGREADTIDNLIAAETLPIPEHVAKKARIASLASLRDRLRQLVIDQTGVDRWV